MGFARYTILPSRKWNVTHIVVRPDRLAPDLACYSSSHSGDRQYRCLYGRMASDSRLRNAYG